MIAARPTLALAVAAFALAGCPAPRDQPPTTTPDSQERAAPPEAPAPVAGPALLLRGARVMTAAGTIYPRADVLLRGDRIVAVGVDLPAPEDATVLDVSGKVITPGIIDTHSHLGVYGAPHFGAHSDGNEAVRPNTADVRAQDGYWPQDPQIDRVRAGGVTTMQVLPGSANLIGGRSIVVHLVPGARSAEDARFPGAPDGLKMACGENPKRVYGEKNGPQTRMGNIAGFRAAFQAAAEYLRAQQRYDEALARYEAKKANDDFEDDEDAEPPEPPARDLALETLAGVLTGDILVHNHCYRADEMSIMMQLAEEYGFEIRSFHHAVEAYKIADRLARRGVAASVWADWWGFKAEAYDGVRENAALLQAAGARPIIHSDSPLGAQRLNQEAAKAMRAGQRAGIEVSEDQALRWITANAAWALGIDDRVGTLEPDKLADVVVWDGDPFSVYSHVERVYIAGRLVYERGSDHNPRTDFEVGLAPPDPSTPLPPAVPGDARPQEAAR